MKYTLNVDTDSKCPLPHSYDNVGEYTEECWICESSPQIWEVTRDRTLIEITYTSQIIKEVTLPLSRICPLSIWRWCPSGKNHEFSFNFFLCKMGSAFIDPLRVLCKWMGLIGMKAICKSNTIKTLLSFILTMLKCIIKSVDRA